MENPNELSETEVCELAPPNLKAEPATIVIYGATGDLTHRKVMPALYNLLRNQLLHEASRIIAFARRDFTDESFREEVRAAVTKHSHTQPVEPDVLERLCSRVEYHRGNLDQADAYDALARRIQTRSRAEESRRLLHYLAVAPEFFGTVAAHLAHAGLSDAAANNFAYSRLVVEKPFGTDAQSASALNEELRRSFQESSLFRIDHYLGKETVQNLMYFRFANSIFEPLWNRRYIDNVQISVLEQGAVGSRAGYYDTAGASRDILQNHLLQLLALVAMEPPATLEAESIREEKVKALRSIPTYHPQAFRLRSVRARYRAGTLEDGTAIPAYLAEEKVTERSTTETFVAVHLGIDNWRWDGVPFYLRTGKALRCQATEICITFKRPPQVLFARHCGELLRSNRLRIRVQPDEGIQLRFNAKVPGRTSLQKMEMDFSYREGQWHYFPEAYERLLLDALIGDATLFTRWDEVQQQWRIVDALHTAWSQDGNAAPVDYAAGSWGPAEADELLAKSGHRWEECGHTEHGTTRIPS